jgi:transposase
MHMSKHEGWPPPFLRRISQKEENFVRGNPPLQNPLFFVANTEGRLPKHHPLRAIKRRADEVLKQMARAFDAAYSETGRPGIPPEALLKALLLQALYSIPSERRLVDAINWNLLYRWFCDLDPDQAVWTARHLRTTASASSDTGWCRSFSSGWWPRRSSSGTPRTITSAWTGR